MRRAVVELELRDLRERGFVGLFERVEALEVVHYFRCDSGGFAGVCRIRPRYSRFRPGDIVGPGGVSKVSVLSEDKSTNAVVAYVESDASSFRALGGSFHNVYVAAPMEIRDEKLRLGFIGKAEEIRRLFRRLDRSGLALKVVSITDERFDPGSPLSSLTEKQRHMLLSAYELGYYDFPRRIKSKQLADMVGLDKSTVVEHLRKAERRLIAKTIAG